MGFRPLFFGIYKCFRIFAFSYICKQILLTLKTQLFMAILSRGFDQTNLSGSVGGVTYRRVGGVTVASQKVPLHVKAKQTISLMATRMRWPNLVAFWRALNTTDWHPSFQGTSKRVSDFNRFMATNYALANVYLPKPIVRAGGGVVAVMCVTEGTLTAVDCSFDSGSIPVTDLAVGTLTLGNSTTLAAFSQAIIRNNPSQDWQNGDQLTLLTLSQTNDSQGIPRIVAHADEVTLDTEGDTTMLSDLIDISRYTVTDGKLGWAGSVTGGVTAVHSRIVDGETVCSTQYLVINNPSSAQYSSAAAFRTACESYGGLVQNAMLTPNVGADFAFNG